MSNQIYVIKPYLWEGVWVFDDPNAGLIKEALVAGIPEIIDLVTSKKGIKSPGDGFACIFSSGYFPNSDAVLKWVKEDSGGNVYSFDGIEGWLCPALFKYFDKAPKSIWVQVNQI